MFLGIDIGTTTVSVVILDQQLETRAVATFPHRADIPAGSDRSEQSAQKIWQVTEDAVQSLDETFRQQVIALGVTGQMHGVLLLDAQGQSISPLVTWQDQRCLADGFLDQIRAKSGYALNSGYGCATLAWFRHHGLLLPSLAKCCTIADYVVMQLAGLSVPHMDVTQAAGWGCCHLLTGQWDEPALAQLGIRVEWLPKILPGISVAGFLQKEMADKWRLPSGLPISLALGDSQASLLATLTNPQEELALTLGTGGQVSAVLCSHAEKELLSLAQHSCEIRPFPGNRYLATAAILCGGSAWSWLATTVQDWCADLGLGALDDDTVYRRLNELGLAATDELLFTPYFSGERGETDLRAAIQGISLDNFSLGRVSRSLARGIMQNLKDRLPAQALKNRQRLMASGNALRRNPLLQQMAQQVFQLPLLLSHRREEAACGAALYAKNMISRDQNGKESC